MRKIQLATDSIYHVYSRGVEKRKIFIDDDDRFRFAHNLFEFNDEESADNIYYRQQALKSYKVYEARPRKILVEIIAFCLRPNHYHLLLRQHCDRGITRFMHKLGTGYSMYFNQKYQRVGGLFQGRFKAVLIEREPHLLYLPHYIHLNALDTVMPDWRDGKIKDQRAALRHLNSYRWSSYLDYTGKRNFTSILASESIKELYGTAEDYQQSILDWITALNVDEITEIILEDF